MERMELLGIFKSRKNVNTSLVYLVLAVCHFGICVANEDDVLTDRKAAWQQHLEQRNFRFQEPLTGIANSIAEFSGDCQLHIVYDPTRKRPASFTRVTIKLIRDGKEVLSLEGNLAAAFRVVENRFIFARFGQNHPGCVVEAYDMTTGKKLWETSELRDFGPFGSVSAYLNEVTIRASRKNEVPNGKEGDAIVVTGRESYGDYIAILDSKTGAILASKVYRIGFEYPHRNDENEK